MYDEDDDNNLHPIIVQVQSWWYVRLLTVCLSTSPEADNAVVTCWILLDMFKYFFFRMTKNPITDIVLDPQ